jgi:two-component system NtrC family sensor kinase
MNFMKYLLNFLLFLLCFFGKSLSQDYTNHTIHITQLPTEGIFLNNGWKFQAGDDPDWAKQDWDDSKWTSVQLSDYNSYLTEFKNKNIGWFRLNLLIDSSIQKRQLAIQLLQLGASEIYLNGKLFQQLGSIKSSLNYKSFNPVDKPLLLPFIIGDSIVIAIRFASEVPSRIWLFASGNKLPLTVRINSWSNAFNTHETNLEQARVFTNFAYLATGLAFLFILFYVLFPKEKVNLLFGALWLFAITNSLLMYKLSQGSLSISEFGLVSFLLSTNGFILGTLSLLIISTAIFNRITFYVWIIFFFFVIEDLRFLFFGPPFFAEDFMGHVAVTIIFFYLSVASFRRRNYIIGIVAFNSFIVNLYFFLPMFHVNLNVDYFVTYIMTTNFIIMTIYVARNFTRKSKNLELQLIEIKKLSEDNLKKEREKQQILTSQKEILEQQVTERTVELKQSLEELKSTQAQLIQSEKMASLGELTAGIAHEIQNPLNFVNNFSEVSSELISEMVDEVDKGNTEDVKTIAQDVQQNLEKILHHGKRADAIVKGMLQHSRISTGQKEPTDINALCDEYLRLSYHGLRAKDKTFNATTQTDFDESIGKISIVPQDIGRVLLNLFNNAFYAVQQKKNLTGFENLSGLSNYEPTVSVCTKKVDSKIEIHVKDNGTGIPQKVVDKIFQPFFTTKPTGQGTGLGLSLSYDIIKAHRGEIKVETKEGEGSEFTIQLPSKDNI